MDFYYQEIVKIIQTGILKEDLLTIHKKMIELSKIGDVEAIKILYLIIRLQPQIIKNGIPCLITNLDYQSEEDRSTICINLANNTVKSAYRLLELILSSFYINPTLRDNNDSTVYGYLMQHLVGIYQGNNNFHSRKDLEKIIVNLSKRICLLYPFDQNEFCVINKHGQKCTYLELVENYQKKNCYFLESRPFCAECMTMNEILNQMIEQELYVPQVDRFTIIKDIETYNTNLKFTKVKRYNLDTLCFSKKHL